MRFMIMVRANAQSEAGVLPAPDDPLMTAMADYHEQLARAGVLLDAAGLKPSAQGWRLQYGADGRRAVIDGPFTETKELIAGYTLIEVATREAALEWARRFPAPFTGVECAIEVRPLYEAEDFGTGDAAERAG